MGKYCHKYIVDVHHGAEPIAKKFLIGNGIIEENPRLFPPQCYFYTDLEIGEIVGVVGIAKVKQID